MSKQTRWTKWDRRFLQMAELLASWSKDPSTGVGCVIVDGRHRVVSTGFNGLPAGVRDLDERLKDREVKLMMTQHAERNALAFSARDTAGCTAYVWPLPPCAGCTGGLIQAGIARIVAPSLPHTHARWGKDHQLSMEMFHEAGVVVDIEPQPVDPPGAPEHGQLEEEQAKKPGSAARAYAVLRRIAMLP